MSFEVQTNRTSATGSGSAGQVIPFTFPVADSSDLVCYKRVTATGVQTDLVLTTNYTVTVTGDTGGSITTVTAIETTEQFHVVRVTAKTQTLDLEHGGTFSAENVEDAFDKQTRIAIDASNKADRSIRFPETDPTSSIGTLDSSIDRAEKIAGYDSDGKPTIGSSTISEVDAAVSGLVSSTGVLAASYQFTGDGSTVAFTLTGGLTSIPNTSSIIVDIDGVTQHTDTYTVSGLVVTFSTAPPDLSDIQIRYNAYLGTATDAGLTLNTVALLGSATLDVTSTGQTTIYTVPAGSRCILDHIKVVAGATASPTAIVSFGQNGAATNFLGNQTFTNLAEQYDTIICAPVPNATPVKTKSYAAATVIEADVTTADVDGGTDNTVYVFGTLY